MYEGYESWFLFSLSLSFFFWQVSFTRKSELRVETHSIDRDETSPIYQRQDRGNESSVTRFVNTRKTADHYRYNRRRYARGKFQRVREIRDLD